MKTISISDETALFLETLSETIEFQDNRATARPIFFTIRKFVDVCVPDGCGDKIEYYDNHDCIRLSEEEAMEHAKKLEMSFDDYVESRCSKYDTRETEEYEGFFLTKGGYDDHIRINGHNIDCNRFDSYVDHIYRNPEMEKVVEAISEIGGAIKESNKNFDEFCKSRHLLTTGNCHCKIDCLDCKDAWYAGRNSNGK